MYGEVLAQQTADHLRSHIGAYLDRIGLQYSDNLSLIVPKSINVSSVVGGLFTSFDEILPQYSVDILGKVSAPPGEDLYTYQYDGQINGMVHAGSDQTVTAMIYRHAAAVEVFVREHMVLHDFANDDFKLVGFGFVSTEMSGAEDLGEVNGRQMWMAGFSIDVSWFTSEDGPQQHASP